MLRRRLLHSKNALTLQTIHLHCVDAVHGPDVGHCGWTCWAKHAPFIRYSLKQRFVDSRKCSKCAWYVILEIARNEIMCSKMLKMHIGAFLMHLKTSLSKKKKALIKGRKSAQNHKRGTTHTARGMYEGVCLGLVVGVCVCMYTWLVVYKMLADMHTMSQQKWNARMRASDTQRRYTLFTALHPHDRVVFLELEKILYAMARIRAGVVNERNNLRAAAQRTHKGHKAHHYTLFMALKPADRAVFCELEKLLRKTVRMRHPGFVLPPASFYEE